MQTQSKSWLPLALIVLAVAIIVAGVLISDSLKQAAATNAQAQQSTTTAITSASFLASEDARLAAQRASLDAQHQATMRMINGN
jgi:uncharacterized protein YoxC